MPARKSSPVPSAARNGKRRVYTLDEGAAILDGFNAGRDPVDDLARGGVGIAEGAALDEFHAAARSACSVPHITILRAS
jgi:hypothetical protein